MPIFNDSAIAFLAKAGILIDCVVTHSAPSFCHPTTKSGIEAWLQYDLDLERDIDLERQTLERIHERLSKGGHPLKNWFYGHFHMSKTEYISGVNYTLLDCFEIKELM